jgi:hypothetical protein
MSDNIRNRNESDSSQNLAQKFENAINTVPNSTKRILSLYELPWKHQAFVEFRRDLFSEGRLYGENIHPESLTLVDTVRYITTTIHEASFLRLDPLLEKVIFACRQAEGTGSKLSKKYNKVLNRLDKLKSRMKDR